MPASERLGLSAAVDDALSRARDVHDAVEQIARTLRGASLAIDRVSVRELSDDGASVTVVALWTSGKATIDVGTTMSALSTSVPEILKTGLPAIGNVDDRKLLESVLLDEGIRSWVTLPITDGARLRAILSLSSRRIDAFDPNDVQEFADLAAAIEGRIVQMLGR
jgi:hypothetical protein